MKTASRLLLGLTITLIAMIFSNQAIASDLNYLLDETTSKDQITKLQTIFSKAGVYEWKIDGKYSSIKPSVVKAQLKVWIISSEHDEKAWKLSSGNLKRIYSVYYKTPQRKEKIADEKKKSKTVVTRLGAKKTGTTTSSNTGTGEAKQGLKKKFIVTAYYSPLRGQRKYSTGSYWGDIRLNWEGTHGASGAAVYKWFLAAPKNYPFGTKIYLEWIGTWIVEDRWGAIVNAGRRWYEHDRIDVWMWYGDAWLTKALQWGKRTVEGEIVSGEAELIQNFELSWAEKYYTLRVNPNSNSRDVKELQELLKKIGAYSWILDGKYKSVEQALIAYQKKKKIIINKESDWAGYFWPKTFSAVQVDLNWELKKIDKPAWTEPKEKVLAAFPNLTRQDRKLMDSKVNVIKNEIKSQSNGNRIIEWNLKRKIEAKVKRALKWTKSKKEKEKLEYLMSLL